MAIDYFALYLQSLRLRGGRCLLTTQGEEYPIHSDVFLVASIAGPYGGPCVSGGISLGRDAPFNLSKQKKMEIEGLQHGAHLLNSGRLCDCNHGQACQGLSTTSDHFASWESAVCYFHRIKLGVNLLQIGVWLLTENRLDIDAGFSGLYMVHPAL